MSRNLSVLAVAALALGTCTEPARAQFTIVNGTLEIQEDWKLVVAQGDSTKEGPQIMTYMSPVSNASTPYAWFLINVRDRPNAYTPGGLQVQIWESFANDTLLASATSTNHTTALSASNETITWTQRLVCNPSSSPPITYSILNGTSTTWSTFGPFTTATALSFSGPTSLNSYSPSESVARSRVGWMANNVTSMTLLTVRQCDKNGKVIRTDNLNLTVNLNPQ